MKTIIRLLTATTVLVACTIISATATVTSHAVCTPPPPGLVGWWPAEGNANDVIGTNSGLLENVAFTNGMAGQAFYLNGTNSVVQIPGSASLKPANITVEAWVKFDVDVTPNANLPGQQIIVFTLNSRDPASGSFTGYCLVKNVNQFAFVIGSPSGVQVVANGTTVPQVGVWYHVAGTYDSGSGYLSIYVNGVLEGSAYAGFPLDYGANTPVLIGTSGEWFDGKLEGAVDEVSIYNRALSTNEISAIYHAGSAGKCPPEVANNPCTPPASGIVGWWPAEGNASDVIGTNAGVLIGGMSFSPGEVGRAFNFNNTNAYVSVPGSASLDVGSGNGFTLEAWINPTDVSTTYPLFEWNNPTWWGVHFHISPGQPTTGSAGPAGPGQLYANIVDDNNNWHQMGSAAGAVATNVFQHVALTYDKTSGLGTIYCNGQIVSQATLGSFTPLTAATYNLNLGRREAPNDTIISYSGLMDEPAIYNRALTAAEIQAIYNAGSAGKCAPAAITNNCVPPPAGLVSWWPGAGNANDVASGNSGTWTGSGNLNVYAPGVVGQAMVFDGTHRDRIDLGNPANLQLQNFTIESWVKRASATIVSLDENFADGSIAGPGGYILGYGPGGYALVVFDDGSFGLTQDSVNDTRVPPVLTDTNWHHVAITKAGTLVTAFVDGVQQPTPSLNPYTNVFTFTTPVAIASRGDGGGNTFYGSIDELTVYNLALSSNEIAAIYTAGSAGKCTSTPVGSTGVPAIFNFSPTAGTNGAVVAIAGTNFSTTAAADIVYFGAVRANVLSASANSLIVTVPTGATYAPITVAVGGLIACANAPFLVTFAGGTNGLTLAPRLDLPAMDGPGVVAFADLDGDGKPDLLVASGNQGISIYQNISTNSTVTAASFAPPVNIPLPAGLDVMTVADVDGDGKLDILFLNSNSNQVAILKNISTPGLLTTSSFATPVTFATGSDPRGLAVQDLDGDGKPELIVGNWGDSTVSVFHNTGADGLTTNSFAAAVTFAVGANPQGLAVADLDGDGLPDIVTANTANFSGDGSQSVSVLRNLSVPGNIAFAARTDYPGLPASYNLAIGDLDGDGKLDLVVSSFNQGQAVSVYRNTSTPGSLTANSFAPHVDFPVGGWGNAVAIGDLDGDGKPDLAVVRQLPDGLCIFKNVSAPGGFTTNSLAPRVDYPTGWNPNGVAIGDLDGDGRPDIAFAVSYAATLSIYQNQTPFGTVPVIIIQPTNQTVAVGGTVTLVGLAQGASPLYYQWTFNGTNLIGATNSSLTLSNVQFSQAGNYALLVTNNYGSATSSIATLAVVGSISGLNGGDWPTFGNGPSHTGYYPASLGGATLTPLWSTNFGLALNQVAVGGGKVYLTPVTYFGQTFLTALDAASGNLQWQVNFASAFSINPPTYNNGNVYVQRGDAGSDTQLWCVNAGDGSVVWSNALTAQWERYYAPTVYGDGIWLDGGYYGGMYGLSTNGTQRFFYSGLAQYDQWTPTYYQGVVYSWVAGVFRAHDPLTGNVQWSASFGWNWDGWSMNTVSAIDNGIAFVQQRPNLIAISLATQTNLWTAAGGMIGSPAVSKGIAYAIFGNQVKAFDAQTGASLGAYPATNETALAGQPIVADDALFVASAANTYVFDLASHQLLQTIPFGGSLSVANGMLYIAGQDGWLRAYVAGQVAPIPVSIVLQPTNQTVNVNGTAVFSVTASGTPPLSYQWSFDGTNLVGATNATLTLNNVSPAEAGNYFVTISNPAGSVVSSNAVLTVYNPPIPPTIVSQTPNQIVLLGNAATFAVTASGTYPLSYFWSRDGALIPNATNSSYILFNAQLSDSGSKLTCLVTNAFGSATSSNMTLKVIDSTVANDLCSGAIVITNASYKASQSTVAATSFGDPTPDCVDGFGHGVWYQFTAPVAGRLIVDTFGSDFDTGLALYTGSCDSLTEVACNDDFGGVTSQVTLPTTAGMTYFILAGGYGSDAGELVLHLNHLTPPAFDVQPTNISVVVSSNAIFNPTLSGTLPMTFQWYFNNAPMADDGRIVGSTNSTLTIANVQMNDGGNYQLVASNAIGVATSSVAVLTPIILPPVFIQPPALIMSLPAGSNANFFAVVDGTPPFSYQWSFNGAPLADDGVHIAGSMTSSLNISNLTTADAGNYTLTVTNLSGSISASETLIVLTPPVFTSQPVGRSVPPGLPTMFNATASGIPAPYYQLQLNGTNVFSGWSPAGIFTVAAVNTNNLGAYQVIAQNSIGSVTSVVAQLTFGPVAAWGRDDSNESLPPPGLNNVVGVAGGIATGLAVKSDGSVVYWGSSNGTNVPASATNVIAVSATGVFGNSALRADGTVVGWAGNLPPAVSNIVSVASGFNFSLALRAEGTVVGWGNPIYSSVPAGLNHVLAISAGFSHALALRSSGTVAAWGTGTATNVPVGLTNVTAIAAGYAHSLALKGNGTVVAWGSGTGTNLPRGLTNIIAVSAENAVPNSSSLALRADGTIITWGDNAFGETNVPPGLTNLISAAIAAAPNHSFALVNDGSPQILHPPVGLTAYTGRDVTLQATAAGAAPLSYQWLLNGTNVPGATNTTLFLPNLQFANAGNYQLFVSNFVNTAISLPAPVNVISNKTLTFLSQTTGGATNYQGSKITVGGVAVLGSGPLSYQWYFSTTTKNYTAVSGATSDTLVLDPALAWQSGNYYVAVSNGFIQLNQTYTLTSAPVSVKVLFARAWGYNTVSNPPVNVTNAIAVATGGSSGAAYSHYLALGADGKVTAWGNLPTGLPVGGVSATNVSALSNVFVTAIAAGYQHSLALKSDGTVYAWGDGSYGQTNPPSGLNSVVAIACGGYHDLALKSDGTVVGWGASGGLVGQFNYGQTTNNPAATNVVAIAAGNLHSLALRADGSVVAWGYSLDGTTTVPAPATNVIGIAAGSSLSVALRANGTVVEWGSGILNYPVPVTLNNMSNVVAVSASGAHCTALRNDGTVVSWGSDYSGVASNYVPADLACVAAIASGGDHDIGLFGTRAPAFTIQPWSRTVFNTTTSVWFSAKCAGVQPVSYQWQLNGTNLPAATNDTLTVNASRNIAGGMNPLPSGVYQLIASNAYGVVASKYAKLTVQIPLGVALNATNLNWTTSGNAAWYGQTNYSHDGLSAARSGGIGASQQSILQTTLATNVAGTVTFWWKVSSEQFFDTLEFDVNGVAQSVISGEVDWTQVSIPLPAGTNVLQWRYSKDPSFDSGLDAGFVDQVAYVMAPKIIQQPGNITANYGDTIYLHVNAQGTPPLSYQWRKNSNPIGMNGPTLALSNVGRYDDGIYSVTVTNLAGAVSSSNAVFHVLVPQRLGTPTLLADGSLQLVSLDAGGNTTLLSPTDLTNFQAQASADLVNWETLPNALSLTNGLLQLQDSSRSNYSTRYYRIIEH